VSGQLESDRGFSRCPNWSELGRVEDNVAHSTGKHAFKISNYFPVKGGYDCPTDAVPAPAVFKRLIGFKNKDMGVWGEGRSYLKGDGVTWGGSFWIAQDDTADKPEASAKSWRLAVKRGRDGKDFAGPQPAAPPKVKVP
jgi:hypothetical protein